MARFTQQRETTLMFDDSGDNRGFVKVFLEEPGPSMITAADGEEVLRLYGEHQSSIVLLLTDLVLSNVNGSELANRIGRIDSELLVLFVSGHAETVFQSLECSAEPFQPLIAQENRPSSFALSPMPGPNTSFAAIISFGRTAAHHL
jgi:CheY-like chemotaxis protein